jgi:hypothetical protein
LRTVIDKLLQGGVTGVFSFSERPADQVRQALAYDMSDILNPSLAPVSMTILMPVVENDQSLWSLSGGRIRGRHMRGQIIFGDASTRFRRADLGQQVVKWFRDI